METQPLDSPTLPLDYRPGADGYDEMCTAKGELRLHWQFLSQVLTALGPADVDLRRREILRLQRDNGITYSAYGDPNNHRRWQLDPVPLLIASDTWRDIERGLIQRAELLSLVLRDLYGPRELLRKGIIPPELIFSHPGFLRPCDGVHHLSHCPLPLYAADLVRSVDGSVFVLSDRAQMPPGAGYALENRILLSRVMPSLFRDSQVHRLALFFRNLRNALTALAWRKSDDLRIVLLSSGPTSPYYFEHAYLANYLGYTLVEGADLVVREGRVWLKSLDGLQPVDVILRYLDDDLCDPLELRGDSLFGVAGLLEAARAQRVAIANPLGCSVLENPGLMAYLPKIAQYFLGQDLRLPSPASYWCGDEKQCAYVLDHFNELVIRPTMRSPQQQALYPPTLAAPQRERLKQAIRRHPYRYVAQRPIARSTAPVFRNGRLLPSPVLIRSFLVAAEESYQVMPGGLTKVSPGPLQTASNLPHSVSKDTWVLASEPQMQLTLLDSVSQGPLFTMEQGELPSRVAENLYWLGRYAERAESVLRLLRAVLLQHLTPMESYQVANDSSFPRLLQAVTRLTQSHPGFIGPGASERLANPNAELMAISLDAKRNGSLANILNSLLYSARSVRDRLSPDLWRVFTDIDERLAQLAAKAPASEGSAAGKFADARLLNALLEAFDELLIAFAAFTGLAIDSMVHAQGWRFLMIGRRLERAQQSILLLDTCLHSVIDNESLLLEQLLKICDSLMTYRSRYRTQVQIRGILELLLLDEENPRALAFQLRRLQQDIDQLPRRDSQFIYRVPERRLILEGLTRLRLVNLDELMSVAEGRREQLHHLLSLYDPLLAHLSDALTNSYFSHADQPQPLLRFVKGQSL